MIVMSWDHVKDFVAIYKGADGTSYNYWIGTGSEMWNGTMETYHFNYAYFLARIISHFCAPGFALLMGTSMVLLSQSRRSKLNWGSIQLLRFFILRGIILVALGFVVRGSELILLIDPNARVNQMLSSSEPEIHALTGIFQVMTCLGLQMIVLSFITVALHHIESYFNLCEWKVGPQTTVFGYPAWLSFGFQQTVLFLLGCCCFLTTHIVIHYLQNGDPVTATTPEAISFSQNLVRFLVVPGGFATSYTLNIYPVIPWLGLSLWYTFLYFYNIFI